MASEHEALVVDVAREIGAECPMHHDMPDLTMRQCEVLARAAVALIAERTKDVSPAMILAWGRGEHALADPDEAREDWQWMHAASALYPDGTGGIEEKAK